MKSGRFTRMFIYAGTAVIAGICLGEAVVGLEILGPSAELEKTVLQQRVASAREVKQALSQPLPPIEPLPPITARLANAHAVQTVSSSSTPVSKNPWSKTNSLPPEALDAMAKSLTTPAPPPEFKESRSRTVDRAVGSGF